MIDYAEIADVKTFARQPDALTDAGWQLLVSSASRLFDTVCEVEPEFFARPLNPQYFAGNDARLLPILALTDNREIHSVAIEGAAYTVPPFYTVLVVGDITSLDAGDGYKWETGSRVQVRADWKPVAAAAIPPDVKHAVTEMAVHAWRRSDPSFTAISQAENSILLAELPPTAQAAADKYRAMYSDRCLFA
jgi:hypothetical protein